MAAEDILLKPEECVMLLVDFQAGLGFGVESMPRQVVVNNAAEWDHFSRIVLLR